MAWVIVSLGACRHEPPREESRASPKPAGPVIPQPTTTGARPPEASYDPQTPESLRDFLAAKRATSTHEEYLAFLSHIARTLSLDDPVIVTAFLSELPLGSDAQGPATLYLQRLSRACTPDTFAAGLRGIQSLQHVHSMFPETLVEGYAKTSPLEALRSLAEHRKLIGRGKAFELAMETALANGLATGKVPMEDLLAEIPEDLPRSAIIAKGEVGAELGKNMDAERLVELLSKAPYLTDQEQSWAASAFGYGLLHARWPEAKRTATLLQTLQSQNIDESLRANIGDGYISSLIKRDLNTALALAATIPPGKIRDIIVHKNINNIASHDRDAAHAWAQSIEDPALREQTLQDLEK
jgi:hypothetical protein